MILVIPVALSEIDQAIDVLGWIDELGGCKNHRLLLVMAYPVGVDDARALADLANPSFSSVTVIKQKEECELGWPKNANAMFKCAADYMRSKTDKLPWLWMELDAIPIRSGWLDTLEEEYKAVGKPIMGAMFNKPYRHINGVAIYPYNLQVFNPWMVDAHERPFDLTKPDATMRVAHSTSKIVRSIQDPATNTPHTFPDRESLSIIPTDCVLFHGCKDGTLIKMLRDSDSDVKPIVVSATTKTVAQKAKGKRLAFVGLMKFPSADILKVLRSMHDLFEVFPDWQGFFSVSSEQMSDVQIMNRWAQQNHHTVTFIPDPRVLPHPRYARMATVRNRYINAIEKSGFNPDYVLSVDLDIAGFADWSGLRKLLEDSTWGAAAVLGLRPRSELPHFDASCEYEYRGKTYCYYDLLALESTKAERTIWLEDLHAKKWYWHGEVPKELGVTFTSKFPIQWHGNDLVDVNSAFGPACLYRWDVVKEFRHNEQDGQICHHYYQSQIRKAGKRVVICPNIVALYSDPWKHVLNSSTVLERVSTAIKKVFSNAPVA